MTANCLARLLFTGAVMLGQAAFHPSNSFLQTGDPFPEVAGPTPAGSSLHLPVAGSGTPALVIFSFSRGAGRDARLWNDRFVRDFPDAGPGYLVLELASVPKLFRGMAVAGIRSGMPRSMQDRAILLDRDEAVWRERLGAADDSRAYVTLVDPGGRILWRNDGAFTESGYGQLRTVLERVLQRRP